MSLWDWAVEAYLREGVSEVCLALQDEHGQNVCYLLWAVWAAPDHPALLSGAGLAREWDSVVLKPLRGVRRRLPASELREDLKTVELKAERALLEALEGVGAAGVGDPLESLERAVAIWGKPAPAPALQRLAEAVSGIEEPR
ncbi:MAG TPA: TIGR02444 family protein [Caulobacteraceae bacterium]|nr:TIGR02444 family protein [Caulobacteraceae bacterium]